MLLKAMTFNLRLDCKSDGINIFSNRRQKIYGAMVREMPDIIGFQEATDVMRAFLREALTEYTVIGCGRNADLGGEGVCLAYRKDTFELISFDTFWLSDTPEIAGSRYEDSDQSQCPRTAISARLRAVETGETVTVFNTHLDHKGEQARLRGMRQTLRAIEKSGGSFVLLGDMNAKPDAECVAEALALKGCKDATADIETTFHNFGRASSNVKIDYIFTNGEPLEAHRLEDEPADGIYISDHYPVCAVIRF